MAGTTGNRGEWSEVYAFLRLLADGKLYAADEQLNRIESMFFPILNIIREDNPGVVYEYKPQHMHSNISIYLNGEFIVDVPMCTFDSEAARLFSSITSRSVGKGAFAVTDTEAFIHSIYVSKLKAPSSDKADICMQVHDIVTGYENVVGFSIKSELGMPPTLLNAGKTTNFVFKVSGLTKNECERINAIDSSSKIKDRVTAVAAAGADIAFCGQENIVFRDNLEMIDSQMPCIVAQMLLEYYSAGISSCRELVKRLAATNPISKSYGFYEYKVKDLLCAVALGMKPATKWSGADEATGGYIIVRSTGDVLAYHIYNRDAFKNYLLENTKFESASSSRHEYGILYEQDGEIYMKLNLQIRFK